MTVGVTEPILEFRDEIELNVQLTKWKQRLQLNDWVIKAELVDNIIPQEDGSQCDGINNVNYANKTAYIKISHARNAKLVFKKCEELVLVHELMHCIIMAVECSERSVEACVFEEVMHQPVEVVARALLMSEYGLDFNWFMED